MIKINKKTEIREDIDVIIAYFGPEEFAKYLPSWATIIEEANNSVDCEGYVFGEGASGIKHILLGMFPDIENPEEGDIVLYRNEDYGSIAHVGLYQKDGQVISKWGLRGPVLKHPIDFVPTLYGETVLFRRLSEQEVNDLHGKDILDFIS